MLEQAVDLLQVEVADVAVQARGRLDLIRQVPDGVHMGPGVTVRGLEHAAEPLSELHPHLAAVAPLHPEDLVLHEQRVVEGLDSAADRIRVVREHPHVVSQLHPLRRRRKGLGLLSATRRVCQVSDGVVGVDRREDRLLVT